VAKALRRWPRVFMMGAAGGLLGGGSESGEQQGTVSMPFFRLSWLTACSILTFSAIPGAEKKL